MWRFSHPAASGPHRWLWSIETSGGSRQSHQPGYASEPSRLCPLARTDASRPGPTLAGRGGCGRGPLLRPRAIRGWDYCLIDSSIPQTIPQKQPAQPVGASSVPMPAFLSVQLVQIVQLLQVAQNTLQVILEGRIGVCQWADDR